jgi:hypothetical protein
VLPSEAETTKFTATTGGHDILSNDAKREYIKLLRRRYGDTTKRSARGQIISEYCLTFGCHRKHALRVLNNRSWKEWPRGSLKAHERRFRRYDDIVLSWLKKLWVGMGYMCSKKMAASLPAWLPYYKEPALTNDVKERLMRMSPATIDRLLAPYRATIWRGLRTGTRRGRSSKFIMQKIPLVDGSIKPTHPGFLQADTVSHCGGNLVGEYAWSLTVTDAYSGWTENRAVWNKLGEATTDAIASILKSLPFTAYRFNVDNGSEFLNEHFGKLFRLDQDTSIVTRSRAYRKNDNCYVEQKNFTTVREIFGYDRMNAPGVVDQMNRLYKNELSLLHNFFVPQMHLKEKVRIGARYKRSYFKPRTPYQILIESPHVTDEAKDKLRAVFQTLDPFDLRRKAKAKILIILRDQTELADKKAA